MSQRAQVKTSPGVLAIHPSATQKGGPPPSSSGKGQSCKANAPRLKLHVRRLPPGLTQSEFESALGERWKVGRGKIDWFSFKEGKVSTDPAKPSHPGRAYLRVVSTVIIPELSDVIRQTSFHDARSSFNDSALLGPPTLEYAPFPRVPSNKVRKDARVGTIDQDADFIIFLESLTNPVTKPSDEESESAEKPDKAVITPLIQFLRDKKANKAKETAALKLPKQSRSSAAREGSKTDKSHGKKQLLSRAEKLASEKQRKDKAAKDAAIKDAAIKDAVKATNKQVSSNSTKAEIKSSTGQAANQPPPASPSTPERRRERERGNMSAATRILRRDLGVATAPRRREKSGQHATSTPNPSNVQDTKQDMKIPEDTKSTPTPNKGRRNASDVAPKTTPSRQQQQQQLKSTPPTEPAAIRNTAAAKHTPTPSTGQQPSTPKGSSSKSQQRQQSQSPSTMTQAFLKHANPSQGVTEDLLEKGFSQFGKIIRVEIDKKKGFGYVDFAEPSSLRKAIYASPVPIAQSQVVVLERKTPAAVAQNRGVIGNFNRGGSGSTGGGGGGGAGGIGGHVSPATTHPQPTPGSARPSLQQTGPPLTPPTPISRGTPQGPRGGRGGRRGGHGRGSGGGGRGK